MAKRIGWVIVLLHYGVITKAQNVGIGTNNPIYGRLVVVGTANSGSASVALFGTNAGISIQQNRPAIIFNGYNATSGQLPISLSGGYGMQMTFNHTNGNMAMIRHGSSLSFSQFTLNQTFLGWNNSINQLRLNTDIPNGTLQVPDEAYATATGNLNLVPLGIIWISWSSENGGRYVNKSGSLIDNADSIGFFPNNSTNSLTTFIRLKRSLTDSYSDIIPIFSISESSTSGTLSSTAVRRKDQGYLVSLNGVGQLYSSIFTTNINDISFRGHIMLYGIK